MRILKKHSPFIALSVLVALVFFVTRIFNILALEIFTDEAIYVRWAQIAKNDAAWRFISLTDGKQPSYVWAAIAMLKFFSDPLLAGRMVSVFAGFGTMIGLFFLSRSIFKNKWLAIATSALYVFYPMGLVYDRLALYDSLVGMFIVWSLFFEIMLVRTMRLDVAMVLGFVIGGAILTKTNAFFAIYLLPFLFLLFDYKTKNWKKKALKFIALACLSSVMAYAFYSIQRLSPFFHIIDEKNTIFVYPLREWLMHPLEYLQSNLQGLVDWFITYFTIPLVVLVIFSFLNIKSYTREKILLAIWFLAPFTALAFFGKTIYPRFILFMTLPLLPLVAYSLFEIYRVFSKKILFALFVFLMFIPLFRADFYVLTDFKNAPIPRIDLDQFSNSWPAGGGIREAIELFKEKSKDKQIFVATEGTFGLLPYAFEIYQDQMPNVKFQGIWPIEDQLPEALQSSVQKMPTYVVFYQPCVSCPYNGGAPSTWPLTKIFEVRKGIGVSYTTIYQVNP